VVVLPFGNVDFSAKRPVSLEDDLLDWEKRKQRGMKEEGRRHGQRKQETGRTKIRPAIEGRQLNVHHV